MSPPLDSFPPEPTNSTRSFLGPDQIVHSESETRSPTEFPLSTHSGDTTPTPFFPHIPRYQIVESLGHGGMGHVFLAHDTQLRRRVALKFMLREAEASAVARQRFTNEATILAQLHHPNVVEVYDSGVAGGYRFFAMTHLPGGSLSKRRKEFRQSAAAAVRVIAAVARGVQHAHERGILHRDLKASNVLFDGDKPVVTDFGCAKWEEAELSTQGAALLGTPSHMAPEVWLRGSKEHDARSDVWSLGVILYQLLAGVLPFPDDPRTEAGRNQLLECDPPPVGTAAEVVPGVDERLEAVMRKVLAKAPSERYQSAAEFADDLDRWLAGEPVSAATDPPTPAELLRPKPRKWWVLVAATAVTLALAGVAFAVSWWPKSDTLATTPEEPPVVKKTLAELLPEKGAHVDLIPETGLPTFAAVGAEGTSGTVGVGQFGGHCELQATRGYMLDLGTAAFPFDVRLEGEVRVSFVLGGETKAGLYADRRGHPQPNGEGVGHFAYFCGYGPISQLPPAQQWKGQWGTNATAARLNATDGSPSPFTCESSAWRHTPPGEQDPKTGLVPFRPVSIDIRADDKHVGQFDRKPFPPGNPTRNERFAFGALAPLGEVFERPLYGDRFGLFVLQGNAQFRNVRLVRTSD